MDNMGTTSSSSKGKLPAIGVTTLKDIHTKLRILNLEATIDKVPTSLDEQSPTVLKYQTPNFRAKATVEVGPLGEGEKWKIGWIQACTDMLFHNKYGDDGLTSWEFPELTSGKQSMISDCDGRHYPWYGPRDETVIIQGPTAKPYKATVVMNDNFHPHVTWRNPANRQQTEPNLTHILRKQSFNVWLVAWNMTNLKSYILKTVVWKMALEIKADPTRPLGERAILVSDEVLSQPEILPRNIPIPRCALTPPNANSAQMLVWRPKKGKAICIIPPIWNNNEPIEKQVLRYDSKL